MNLLKHFLALNWSGSGIRENAKKITSDNINARERSSLSKLLAGKHRIAVLCFAALLSFQSFIYAQEPTPTPDATPTPTATPAPTPEASPTPTPDPVQEKIDELEKQTKLEKAQKDLIEAQKARIKAYLPTSETKALEGKVEFDEKVTFSSEKMAYDALNDLAGQIVPQINGANADRVIVLGDAEIKALQDYNQTLAQIKGLGVQYKNLSRKKTGGFEFGAAAVGMIPEIATAFTKSIIDFASLFKTDVKIKGLEFSMETQSITSALVANGGNNFYDPSMFPPNITRKLIDETTGTAATDTALFNALGELVSSYNEASRLIAEYESKTGEEKAKDIVGKKDSLMFKPLNDQVDKFLADLVTVNESGANKLTSLILAESIIKLLDDTTGSSYVLRLKVIRAAGTNTTKTNLFTGTKLNFTGGTIIRYCLFDMKGKMITRACGIASAENRAKLKL